MALLIYPEILKGWWPINDILSIYKISSACHNNNNNNNNNDSLLFKIWSLFFTLSGYYSVEWLQIKLQVVTKYYVKEHVTIES